MGISASMDALVYVWVPPDLQLQHHAPPPDDDTTKEWEGVTACGITGQLRWIHGETVDRGATCERCTAVVGAAPPLEGDDPGPV